MRKKKQLKRRVRRSHRGAVTTGTIFVVAFLILLAGFGFLLTGGKSPTPVMLQPEGEQMGIQPAVTEPAKNQLQLYTFGGVTVTPKPPPPTLPAPPLKGDACISNPFNEEPETFVGSSPASGQLVTAGQQLKVWIADGNGGSISPGEKIDPATGQITTPGDRTANDGRGTNYYLWEPSLYITKVDSPTTPGPFAGDAENGGQPAFPSYIKGDVTEKDDGPFLNTPPADPPPTKNAEEGPYIAQYIWEVNSLNLPQPGYYRVQFIVHDGDGDLGINCFMIQK